jgi:hypothetical protein
MNATDQALIKIIADEEISLEEVELINQRFRNCGADEESIMDFWLESDARIK